MKAPPEMQARLLELVDLDTRLTQLAHQLRSLPELTDIARLEEAEAALEEDVVRAQTELSDVRREVTRAEEAVQLVRDRTARNQQRLDAGTGSPKDLQGMQHELESLARRQGVLEDEELEAMERAEQAEAAAEKALAAREAHREQLATLHADRDRKAGVIAVEHEQVAGGREAITADLSEELLALYERLRARSGTGAAPLLQRRCDGCRLELNAVDLGRIKAAPEDEVLRCEECGRILVRTAESGL